MRLGRRQGVLRTGIVFVTCFCLVMTPYLATIGLAYADPVVDEAKKGQDTALNFLLNYQPPTLSNSPPLDPLGPNELNLQELFPGYNPADPSQITDLSDLMSNPADLSTQGVGKQFSLGTGTDETAEAYQALDEAAINPNYGSFDLRTDDFLDRSRDILAGTDPLLDEILTACAEDVTAGTPGDDTVERLEDIWTCTQRRNSTLQNCTVTRDFELIPVATQVVLSVVGGVCVPTPGGTGNDLSDWTALYGTDIEPWVPVGGDAAAPMCRSSFTAVPTTTFGTDDYWVGTSINPFPPNPDRMFFAWFCGERDTTDPTPAQCASTAQAWEHICRSTDNTSTALGDYSTNSAKGPPGSCLTYPPVGLGAVDYTGCTQERIDFCSAMKQDFEYECSGVVGNDCGGTTCSGGSGQDISDHTGFSEFDLGAAKGCISYEYESSPVQTWTGGAPVSEAWVKLTPAFALNNPGYVTTGFCGEFDTYEPTVSECESAGYKLENLCRNANGNIGTGHRIQLNTSLGSIGSCTSYSPEPQGNLLPTTPPSYAGCTPDRQTYCEQIRDEFIAECGGTCSTTCEAEDNIPIYDYLSVASNSGPVSFCRSSRTVFNYSTPPLASVLGGPPKDFSFFRRTIVDPGDYEMTGWSTDACGDTTTSSCTASADSFESLCNNASTLMPDGSPTTPAYCAAERSTYEANCNAANTCLAPSSAPTLTGIETIIHPGLGDGTADVLVDQPLFGTLVEVTEDGFNPADYGLVAGEYVIGNHTVTGDGIVSESIDDGGSYGSNWDYTATVELNNSTGFQVEATIYEIDSNVFQFTGCSQSDVQNVTNGVCSGSVTCTDYTPPCRTIGGLTFCEPLHPTDGVTEVLEPWSTFTTGIPEMCWEADVVINDCVGNTNCIGNPACVNDCADLPADLQAACQADACWVDAQGATICLDDTSESWTDNLGDTGFTDDCGDLLSRDECTLLPDVSCVEGMEDDADPTNINLCNLRTRYFDCGRDVVIPGVPGADDVDVTCGAEIRCFGDECANTTAESNPDFVRAATAASTVSEAAKDMDCDIQGDPTSCKLFEGTDNRCKDPRGSYLGIIPDCCEESRQAGASAGDFITYMNLARLSFKLARDPMVASWLSQGEGLPSGLQKVVNAPAQAGRAVGRTVVSGFNSALEWAGFQPIDIATESELTKSAISGSPTGFGPIQQFIAGGVYDFLVSIGAEEFANSLFATTAEGQVTSWATDGIGQMVGDVLNVLGFIYTVYNVLKILGSILFACEEEELAFGIQQVNRACHFVGTYCSKKVSFLGLKKCIIETQTHCCFSGPFARILNEQLREQGIGPDWGTAQEPNCEGITVADLENVDWSLVDLSEWEAIIFEAGLVPDPRNPPLNFVPTERHEGLSTGGSSGTNEGATSTDINQETINLVMPTLDEARFGLNGATLHQPDPELMPWYDDKN